MIRMKREIALALLLLPLWASAQVEKRVEVMKDYTPRLAAAAKLAIAPDLTDTVKIRPDIDYTVVPRSFDTNMATHLFRPATVTYWEFNRPTPFYLKLGAGYPLNSAADFSLSTQNPSIGYALLYVNHEGDYAKIHNDAGAKPRSWRMSNRIGAAAGRYLGRHVLEGTVYYDNRLFHRYAAADPADELLSGSRIQFGEAGLKVRIGDDFRDDRKVDFNAEAYGTFFHDDSKTLSLLDARQIDGGGSAFIGFRLGRHRIHIRGGFDGAWGAGDMSRYSSSIISAGLGYAFRTRTVTAEIGLNYLHNRISMPRTKHDCDYLLPRLRVLFDAGHGVFTPFIEFDGELHGNSFRDLVYENPYVLTGLALPKSTVDYTLRFGVAGNLNNKFAYRLFVAMTWVENARYWFGMNLPQGGPSAVNPLQFGVLQARRNTATVGGELKWKLARDLRMEFTLRGYLHDFIARIGEQKLGGGLPALESALKLRYDHRRFSLYGSARLTSTRHWSNLLLTADSEGAIAGCTLSTYKVPVTVDVRLGADYRLSPSTTLFLEGRNLADQRLFDWANYPLPGIGFIAGVKLTF